MLHAAAAALMALSRFSPPCFTIAPLICHATTLICPMPPDYYFAYADAPCLFYAMLMPPLLFLFRFAMPFFMRFDIAPLMLIFRCRFIFRLLILLFRRAMLPMPLICRRYDLLFDILLRLRRHLLPCYATPHAISSADFTLITLLISPSPLRHAIDTFTLVERFSPISSFFRCRYFAYADAFFYFD